MATKAKKLSVPVKTPVKTTPVDTSVKTVNTTNNKAPAAPAAPTTPVPAGTPTIV